MTPTPLATSDQLSCTTNGVGGGLCDRCKELGETQPITAKEVLADDQLEETFAYDPSQTQDPIIGRAPLEISSYIFELYVQLHETRLSLRLGAVCRTWRKIAWSHPRLWTSLEVDISSKGCRHAPELAAEWIQRTGILPLSIHLYDSNSSLDDFDDTICPDCVTKNAISLIKVLNLVSFRWEELVVSISFDLVPYIDDGGPDVGSPSILRRLIVGIVDRDIADDLGPRALFKRSKRRHSPTEVGLSEYVTLDAFDIDWTNVTDFDVHQLTSKQACELFQRAPSLKTCVLNQLDHEHEAPLEVIETIIAKSLCSLTVLSDHYIWAPGEAFMSSLFDCLTLPSLEDFSFYGYPFVVSPMPTTDSLVSFIQRSQCSLQHLELHFPPITDASLIEVLQVMPTLKSLELNFRQDATAAHLLESLGTKGPAGTGLLLLPDLEYLSFIVKRTVPWPLVARLFGPVSPSNAPYPSQRHDLEVDIKIFESDSKDYIDRRSLIYFMHLLRCGVDISILKNEGHGYSCNFIEESRKVCFPRAAPH